MTPTNTPGLTSRCAQWARPGEPPPAGVCGGKPQGLALLLPARPGLVSRGDQMLPIRGPAADVTAAGPVACGTWVLGSLGGLVASS